MAVNQILPFCPTDTGSNLLGQGDYDVATGRTIGNQPGVASSKLVNKALRQSSYLAAELGQFIADKTGTDVLDDATPAKLLAQMNAAFKPISSTLTKLLSGTGTFAMTYYFMVATASATSGATYTHNGQTYTVKTTVASGVQLIMTGTDVPLASGVLTKATGTGDATITFYAMRAPTRLRVRAVGGASGGGGGAGSGGVGNSGGIGGNTTFGSSLITAGGAAAQSPDAFVGALGGTPTVAGVAVAIVALQGGSGSGGVTSTGGGAASPFGGAGGAGYQGASAGIAAIANSGSGGGGGGSATGANGGAGGGAGAYVETLINSPSGTYPYAVGAGGNGGLGGLGGGQNGGNGGSGQIIVEELY